MKIKLSCVMLLRYLVFYQKIKLSQVWSVVERALGSGEGRQRVQTPAVAR